jgi:hypothetical protein
VIGAGSAVIALRRIAISPLGVTRRERSRPISRLRVAPLALSMIGFPVALLLIPVLDQAALWLIAATFFGVIVGIAIAGPWLTMLVGRAFARVARGPSDLLAARRLTDDPRSTFGAIAGVVMAVFVASVFYSVAAYAGHANARIGEATLPPATLDVEIAAPPGDAGPALLAAGLPSVEGVRAVGVVRAAQATTGTGALINAWIADCGAVTLLLPGAGTCGPGTIYGVDQPAAALGLRFDRPDLAGSRVTPRTPTRTLPLPADAAGRVDVVLTPDLLPDDAADFAVTRLLAATDGAPSAIERARTAVEAALPTAKAWTAEEQVLAARGPLDELGRIVALGLIGTLLVAGCSLAIAVVGGIVERRRPLALLRLAGMPLRGLQAMAILEAAVPLLVVTLLAAAIGVTVGQILLRFGTGAGDAPLPGLELPVVLALGVAAALGVVGVTLPMIGRATAIESTRFE